MTLRDVLAAFASPAPTPGGGSASALAAVVGVSLLRMVCALQKTRSGTEKNRTTLAGAAVELDVLRERLTDAIDRDTSAYDGVVAAYRLPKTDEGERAARVSAVQAALRQATEAPLEVMRWSAGALARAAIVAAHGHRAAASDIGVAVALLDAGFRGARLNVETNLEGVSESGYKEAVRAEVEQLARAGAESCAHAQTSLR